MGFQLSEIKLFSLSRHRQMRFGQHDRVRFYGWDFEERLRDAGFQVTVVRASDVIDANQFEQVGITKEEVLFYCQNNLALEN